jgi:hypothetical protein
MTSDLSCASADISSNVHPCVASPQTGPFELQQIPATSPSSVLIFSLLLQNRHGRSRILPLYVYESPKTLEHILVVILQPAIAHNDELKADIIQYDRLNMRSMSSTIPVYEAVSYTWGDPDFSHILICYEAIQFRITPNVNTMLRYFRQATKPRYLWIDAICFNQADERENRSRLVGWATSIKMRRKCASGLERQMASF